MKSADEIGNLNIDTKLIVLTVLDNPNDYLPSGAIGMIRSRKDQDLRSNSVLNVIYGSNKESRFGIASGYLLDAWSAGSSSIGDSDLILEGGGL